MKSKILLTIAVALTAVGLATTGMAASSNEDSNINVNVLSKMNVDISPDTLTYSNVIPGGSNATSDAGYTGVEIENIGSTNITNLYMATSQPSSRTFGSGTASAYDAGNFVQIQPSGEIGGLVSADSDGGFHFVSRREYNESNTLSYIDEGGVTELRYGRFREANETFFWGVSDTATGGSGANWCSSSGELYIGKTPHTRDTLGAVDFGDNAEFYSKSIGNANAPGDYGRVDDVWFQTYEGNKTYSAFTWCGGATASGDNSTHVIFSRYNIAPSGGSTVAESIGSLERLMNSSGSNELSELQPGEHFTAFTRVSVPFGVAQGSIGQGTLTVYANDN